ncbi:hypothetical protein ACQ9SK_004603 [Escherichia coli]
MNKKIIVSLIAGTVMMSASIASMAAANPVGTHNTTVSGSFVSPTCMVTEWPQDISFDPISVADWGNYNVQETIQVKSQGQFVLTGCPANTGMKYSVTAETLAQGNPYQALAKDADLVSQPQKAGQRRGSWMVPKQIWVERIIKVVYLCQHLLYSKNVAPT